MTLSDSWHENFEALKAHVAQTGHFPNRHTRLNNRCRYQRKRSRQAPCKRIRKPSLKPWLQVARVSIRVEERRNLKLRVNSLRPNVMLKLQLSESRTKLTWIMPSVSRFDGINSFLLLKFPLSEHCRQCRQRVLRMERTASSVVPQSL